MGELETDCNCPLHRVLTITAIAQLMVLGCTWVFGLLLFDPDSTWLSYIFTLLNCLQGLFLFVMLCLLNKKVGRQAAGGRAGVEGAEARPDSQAQLLSPL